MATTTRKKTTNEKAPQLLSVAEAIEIAEQNHKLHCKALYDGISKEAWEIITKLAKADIGVFTFREEIPGKPKQTQPVPYDAQTICLIAARNDGRQSFYKTLRAMRKTGRDIAGKS